MFQCFYPGKMEDSSYVIPYEDWKKMGIQGIIYDIDNTLVPHGAPADERAIQLFEHLRMLGFKTCLLSNNKEPRVKSFAQQVRSQEQKAIKKPWRLWKQIQQIHCL